MAYEGVQVAGRTFQQSSERHLRAIHTATLTPVVRRATDSPTMEISRWNCDPLQGGIGGGAGGTAIYRFSGEGTDQGKSVRWSLILKILYSRIGESPSDSHYWRREAEAYQSGWLSELPLGGLVAPRCFGIEDLDDASWIWLEDVEDESVGRWSLERYGIAARHLGQFNGAYLAGTMLPDWTWLSSDWIGQDLARVVQVIEWFEGQPAARSWFPTADAVLGLWAKRDYFLQALDCLPQTICHFDAFRRNLFTRRGLDGQDQTVAIDWAFTGIGPIGAELVALVWVSLVFQEADFAMAHELDQIVFEGYIAGLRDSGWRGDPKQVRLGYTAAIGLRRITSIGHGLQALNDGDETITALMNSIHIVEAGRFVESLTNEASNLINTL